MEWIDLIYKEFYFSNIILLYFYLTIKIDVVRSFNPRSKLTNILNQYICPKISICVQKLRHWVTPKETARYEKDVNELLDKFLRTGILNKKKLSPLTKSYVNICYLNSTIKNQS